MTTREGLVTSNGKPRVVEREYIVTVRIEIGDERVIRRCVENEDDWQGMFYDYKTEEDVLDALAHNIVANGVDRVNRLDGWADLDDDAARMDVVDVSRW